MTTMLKKLREARGDLTSALISLLILMAAFALVLTALPVFTKLYYLNAYLDDVVRYIELTGTTAGIADTLSRLNEEYFPAGDAPSLDLSSGMDFLPGTDCIQLGDPFSVSAEILYDFRLTGFFSFPLKITARSTGRSEVFHK